MKRMVTISILLVAIVIVSRAQPKRAAFLISDGTLPLDYVGAYEVLGQAGMRVFTVARTMDTVKLSSNMQILPNYSITTAPAFDILVVPSPFDNDTMVIDWIRERSKEVEHILTVCTGVTPVYDAGLLDGKTITSYGPLLDHLRTYATKATVVSDKRFVDNGKVITCGSYVSGIDGALYLVSKMYGIPRAQEVANNLEYNWDKEYKFVRSKLADNWLTPLLDFGPPLRGEVLRYDGDENQWMAEYKVTRRESFKEFYSQLPEMAEMHHWKNVETNVSDSVYYAKWTRMDYNDREWFCITTLKQLDGSRYHLAYKITRRE